MCFESGIAARGDSMHFASGSAHARGNSNAPDTIDSSRPLLVFSILTLRASKSGGVLFGGDVPGPRRLAHASPCTIDTHATEVGDPVHRTTDQDFERNRIKQAH